MKISLTSSFGFQSTLHFNFLSGNPIPQNVHMTPWISIEEKWMFIDPNTLEPPTTLNYRDEVLIQSQNHGTYLTTKNKSNDDSLAITTEEPTGSMKWQLLYAEDTASKAPVSISDTLFIRMADSPKHYILVDGPAIQDSVPLQPNTESTFRLIQT